MSNSVLLATARTWIYNIIFVGKGIEMNTIIIKNALIYDGTGEDPFNGSILIKDDEISDILTYNIDSLAANEVIDANGYVCTPGFIDIHRHADYALFSSHFGSHELLQGLTTIVNGNCGMSGAPLGRSDSSVIQYQEPIVGKLPESVNTNTILSYSASLKAHRPAVNAGMLAGLGTIAGAIIGIYGPFAKDSIHAIQSRVEQAVSDGALGVSLGLGYKPAISYSTHDIVSALEPIRNTDVPVTVHMRQEGDGMLDALAESISIAKNLNVPFEISHLKAIGKANWRNMIQKALSVLHKAIEEGVRIGWDIYPYTAGSTQLMHVLPPEICGKENLVLSDPLLYRQVEKRIREDSDFENIIRLCGFENIFPGYLQEKQFEEYNGLSIKDGAIKAGMEPLRWLLTILSEEKGSPSMLDFITCEDDIISALRDPNTAIISDSIYPADGNYHPRVAGTYSRIIEKYVLQENALTLSHAIRQMTYLPAKRLNINNRGLLKKQFKADICVFDPLKIKERAQYGKELIPSSGMEFVLVNGKFAVKNGQILDLHAGKCI